MNAERTRHAATVDDAPSPRPTVSVGLPVFNGERYVEEAIASILSQTYEDFELIISDNASEDRTREICESYASKDARVRILRSGRNAGAARNYNRVFTASRGRYFKWIAHDDLCAPRFIERCVEVLDAAPPIVSLVYPRGGFIDAQGRYIRDDPDVMATTSPRAAQRLAHAVWSVNLANAIFGLIRADVLSRTRLIAPFISSDYVLLVELALLGHIVEVPEVLSYRRFHEGSSREANTDLHDVLAWFDPQLTSGVPRSFHLSLLREYHRSVSRLVTAPAQRWACHAVIPSTYGYRRSRAAAGRARRSLTRSLAKDEPARDRTSGAPAPAGRR